MRLVEENDFAFRFFEIELLYEFGDILSEDHDGNLRRERKDLTYTDRGGVIATSSETIGFHTSITRRLRFQRKELSCLDIGSEGTIISRVFSVQNRRSRTRRSTMPSGFQFAIDRNNSNLPNDFQFVYEVLANSRYIFPNCTCIRTRI